MTVSAGIEISTGGQVASGSSGTLATTPCTGSAGAGRAVSSSSATHSFRASWQSQLAFLGTQTTVGSTEANALDGQTAGTSNIHSAVAGKASAGVSTATSTQVNGQGQDIDQKAELSSSADTVSTAITNVVNQAALATATNTQLSTAGQTDKSAGKSLGDTGSTESSSKTHSAKSDSNSFIESAASQTQTVVIPTVTDTSSQAMPMVVPVATATTTTTGNESSGLASELASVKSGTLISSSVSVSNISEISDKTVNANSASTATISTTVLPTTTEASDLNAASSQVAGEVAGRSDTTALTQTSSVTNRYDSRTTAKIATSTLSGSTVSSSIGILATGSDKIGEANTSANSAVNRSQAQVVDAVTTQVQSQNSVGMQNLALGTDAISASVSSSDLVAYNTSTDAVSSQSTRVSAASSGVGKVSASSGGRSSSQASAEVESVSSVTNTSLNGSLPIHDPLAGSGLTNAANIAAESGHSGISGSATTTSSSMTAGDTFAALDADTGVGTPTWTHAGGQRAEAGFQDPDLGWVGVQANLSGSGVHASLVASSTDAAQALGSHLAGLNAYLAKQHTSVETLTLSSSSSGTAEFGMDQGANQSMNQGSGQNSSSYTGQDATAERQYSSSLFALDTTSTESAISTGITDAAAQAVNSGGAYISVMA